MSDNNNPLFRSFQKIKNAFFEKSEEPQDHADTLRLMSKALSVAVKKIFFEKSKTKFSDNSSINQKAIVAFNGKLRIDAMEKFNQTTILSVVHYYKNSKELEAGKQPLGLIIIYLERKYIPEMLRLLQYPYIDFDDDNDVLDGAGAMINVIAGQFKAELRALGYQDLEMSHFQSFINNVPQGVDYPRTQTERYELSFNIDDKKRLVVEMVMAPLLKVSA
jgi:hypothetical protein